MQGVSAYPLLSAAEESCLTGKPELAARSAKTDLIVRLDSDDRLEPDYVKVLVELMRQHPQAGFAHCDVGELDKDNRRPRIRRLRRTKTFESGDEALRSNATGYRTAANCILYRAQALRDVNHRTCGTGLQSGCAGGREPEYEH
jgi:GT2 family glycosyltransferase